MLATNLVLVINYFCYQKGTGCPENLTVLFTRAVIILVKFHFGELFSVVYMNVIHISPSFAKAKLFFRFKISRK